MPYLGPEDGKPFRRDGLKEGLRRLREDEFSKVFSTFSRLSSQERLDRFSAARAALKKLGGSAEIVRGHHGDLRLRLRMEFPTRDKKMDASLYKMVSGVGFELSLESRPGKDGAMERSYVVAERPGSDRLEHVHGALERALELHAYLRCNVRMPRLGKAEPPPLRAAESLEPGAIMERLAAAMQGTR